MEVVMMANRFLILITAFVLVLGAPAWQAQNSPAQDRLPQVEPSTAPEPMQEQQMQEPPAEEMQPSQQPQASQPQEPMTQEPTVQESAPPQFTPPENNTQAEEGYSETPEGTSERVAKSHHHGNAKREERGESKT